MAKPANSRLESIITPVSLEAFWEQYWPREVLAIRGPLSRLSELTAITALWDVDWLLRHPQLKSKVYRDDPRTGMPAPIVVQAAEGGKALREGCSINLEVPARVFPALGAFCSALARDLGADTGTSSVFLGPPGRNLRPHTDPVEVVSFQLQGRKRWYLGASELSEVSGLSELPDLSESQDPRSELLQRGRVVDAQAGSVLFMPRDVWHATEDLVGGGAAERSISLSVAIRGASWASHAAAAITEVVSADPRWTRALFAAGRTAERRAGLRNAAMERCAELREAIQTEPLLADIMPAEGLPRDGDRFRTAERWRLGMTHGEEGDLFCARTGDRVALSFAVDPPVRPLFLLLAQHAEWVEFSQLAALVEPEEYAQQYLRRVLTMLYEVGALEWD